MKKITIIVALFLATGAQAQIDLNNINLNSILGKVLNVKKGYAPKFSLGKQPINKIIKVAEIFGVKNNPQATKLFNTFKTGRTVYRIAEYAAGAVACYSAIKAIDKSTIKEDYQKPLVGALSTAATGLIIKMLTKGASYKAVDIFNGAVKKKLSDILGVAPASSTMGIGVYVKL